MVRLAIGRATSSPSVSISAASTPSSEVPLIRPMTFEISAMCAIARGYMERPDSFTMSGKKARAHTMPPAQQFQSEFLRTFVARGAFYACSEPAAELDALFQKERVTAYIGFDCTA